MDFRLVAGYEPTGDQPEAIEQMVQSITQEGNHGTTLLGVTGSGKTFTVANVIARLNRPTLVILLRLLPARGIYTLHRHIHRERPRHKR